MDSYILKKRKRKLYYFFGGCQIKLALYWGINLLFRLINIGSRTNEMKDKTRIWIGDTK